ncbi:MAG: hypothetical protein IJX60_03685, partial [Paludibacteraceae bacterium]|nr:hypothetical protein [Paludibacteraceae bacterium]
SFFAKASSKVLLFFGLTKYFSVFFLKNEYLFAKIAKILERNATITPKYTAETNNYSTIPPQYHHNNSIVIP